MLDGVNLGGRIFKGSETEREPARAIENQEFIFAVCVAGEFLLGDECIVVVIATLFTN